MSKIAGLTRGLEGIRAVDWGVEHEPIVVQQFEAEAQLSVHKTGFWLHESGVLGASPDGIIGDGRKHLVEVKCPYKFRNSSMRQGLTGCNDYVVRYDEGKWLLNKKHFYYHQIQGQIYVLDALSCFLILYAPHQKLAIIPVPKDPVWMSTKPPKLFQFYVNKYLPYAFPSC